MLTARIEEGERSCDARVANVSAGGAMVAGPKLEAGASVKMQRAGVDLPGKVIWASLGVAGLAFDGHVDHSALLRPVPKPRQRITVRPRRPGLRCAPLSDAEKAFLTRWSTAGNFRFGD